MPTFFGRRYARKPADVSNVERAIGLLIVAILGVIIAAYVIHVRGNRDFLFELNTADGPASASSLLNETSRGAASDLSPGASSTQPPAVTNNLFPSSGVELWRTPQRAEHYGPDDLYLKIDGRADAYLEHNIIGLTFGTYVHERESNRTIDVFWYQFAAPADAAAAYEAEKPPDPSPVSLSGSGYQVGGAVFFCTGSSYVQIIPARPGAAAAQAALRIAQALAEQISRAAP